MGGFGSGGWNRTGRLTTTDALCLDVNRLNRAGVLRPGASGTSSWTRGDEPIGNINITASENCVTLIYRSRVGGEDWTSHNEHVHISWQPCRFGGQRPFFRCPGCSRRVLYLYGLRRYLCRHCHQLSYPSQRERDNDRAQRKANRIRERLGGEGGWQNIPPRPKGMHRRTYDRLIKEIRMADAITDDAAVRLITQLEKSSANSAKGFWQ